MRQFFGPERLFTVWLAVALGVLPACSTSPLPLAPAPVPTAETITSARLRALEKLVGALSGTKGDLARNIHPYDDGPASRSALNAGLKDLRALAGFTTVAIWQADAQKLFRWDARRHRLVRAYGAAGEVLNIVIEISADGLSVEAGDLNVGIFEFKIDRADGEIHYEGVPFIDPPAPARNWWALGLF